MLAFAGVLALAVCSRLRVVELWMIHFALSHSKKYKYGCLLGDTGEIATFPDATQRGIQIPPSKSEGSPVARTKSWCGRIRAHGAAEYVLMGRLNPSLIADR